MTKNVQILKTGAYNPIKGALSKYESLELITLYQYSPGIIGVKTVLQNLDLQRLKETTHILHSTLKRTQETAQVIARHSSPNPKRLRTHLLNEIKFSLKALVSKEEYQQEGSNLVRQRFIEAFAKDMLLEKRASILARIKALGKILQKLQNQPNTSIICISHSFFMKILQIYLKDKALFEKPQLLEQYFNPFQRTFEFCQGFEFDPQKLF